MKRLLLGCMFLAIAVSPASAIQLLAPGSSWEYTFTQPGANWNTNTGGWATGPAPFGNHTGGWYGDFDFDYATYWPVDGSDRDGYDLWVRTTVDLTGIDLATVTWGLGVDNGFSLYANGVGVANANAEGYTYRWEYSGGFGSTLTSGQNVIAVALEDHGGLTAFDMEINGDLAPVPEPGTMLLLGSGLLGLAGYSRKRCNA